MKITRAHCIYCSNPTGSDEHVLPAAMGGLHTNRGILCGECNVTLGRTVDAHFAARLRPLSSRIGVRNREGELVAAEAVDPATGFTYKFEGGGVLLHKTPATIADEKTAGVRTVRVVTSSQKQADDLVHQMKSDGDARLISRTTVRAYFVENLKMPFAFGVPDDFRGAARWALNVFAHHYPELARSEGLAALKKFIRCGQSDETFAWFASGAASSSLAPDSFPFQHRIVISFDPETSSAHAHATFLGTLHVGVRFGHVPSYPAETIVHEADVLAVKVEDSFCVTRFAFLTPLPSSEPYPALAFESALAALEARVSDRLWGEDAPPLVANINAVRDYSAKQRHDALFEVLDGQSQRILNLATEVARRDAQDDAPHRRGIANVLRHLLTPDVHHPSGVGEETLSVLESFRHGIAHAISIRLASGPIDELFLRNLLEGETGRESIREVIQRQIVAAMHARSDR